VKLLAAYERMHQAAIVPHSDVARFRSRTATCMVAAWGGLMFTCWRPLLWKRLPVMGRQTRACPR